jgi:hypothetical protein
MGDSLNTFRQHEYLGVFMPTSGFEDGFYTGEIITKVPTGLSTCPGSIYDSAVSALEADAKSKALSKARDMKANVAVALGEGRQTVRMITDTANRLGRSYRAFRKGHFGRAAKELGISKPTKSAANHWLEYSYGWMPLLSDVKGLAELAAQHVGLGGRQKRFSVHAQSVFSKPGQMIQNPTAPCNYAHGELVGYFWQYDFTATGRCGLLLELDVTTAALAAQTGFGLTDPLLLAWELTPFSFVFDWFIDVGTYLENIGALQGLKVLDGFYSITRDCKGEAWGGRKDNSGWALTQPPPKVPFTLRNYSRVFWNGSAPSLRMPLADGLNARRLVTSAALWRQRLRGDRVPGHYHP